MANRPISWVPINDPQVLSPRVSKKTKLREPLSLTPTHSPDVQRKQTMSPYPILPDLASPRSPSTSPTTLPKGGAGRHFFGADFPMAPSCGVGDNELMTQQSRRSLTPIPEMRLNDGLAVDVPQGTICKGRGGGNFFGADFPMAPSCGVGDNELMTSQSRRSLTPIPEMRLNDALAVDVPQGTISNESKELSSPRAAPDFVREIQTPRFHPDDIKIIIDQNKIRIIGESSPESDYADLPDFNKTINIPFGTDPLSIKVEKQPGLVRITGYSTVLSDKSRFKLRNVSSIHIPVSNGYHENSPKSPQQSAMDKHEYIECILKLPRDINPEQLHYRTITKHYLIVDDQKQPGIYASDSKSDKSQNEANGEYFPQVFELPVAPGENELRHMRNEDGSFVVRVPIGR